MKNIPSTFFSSTKLNCTIRSLCIIKAQKLRILWLFQHQRYTQHIESIQCKYYLNLLVFENVMDKIALYYMVDIIVGKHFEQNNDIVMQSFQYHLTGLMLCETNTLNMLEYPFCYFTYLNFCVRSIHSIQIDIHNFLFFFSHFHFIHCSLLNTFILHSFCVVNFFSLLLSDGCEYSDIIYTLNLHCWCSLAWKIYRIYYSKDNPHFKSNKIASKEIKRK